MEFPLRLAGNSIGLWIFIDVGRFRGHEITLTGPASAQALGRIYQADSIAGQDTLYRERNRPQYHFTVKRGWSNDVNGPIYYRGQYHLFWQAMPFGLHFDDVSVGFMHWGHAVSADMLHWRELPFALAPDRLGSPWSGTAVIDRHNDGGWGRDALVLFYTSFDRRSKKQVQCIAFSRDGGHSFERYLGNPVLDTNREMHTNDTRDPKVFRYEPGRHWVMVLFEKDGMSIFHSTDLKSWTRKSHFPHLHECPDFFELPIENQSGRTKWILHGGSSSYYIGSFDGERFVPESGELRYAEGSIRDGEDILYAAQSFTNMPGGRRVQIAWGRIEQPGMPFNQMMLFPTEFRLAETAQGLRLLATPIAEIDQLHGQATRWPSLTLQAGNKAFSSLRSSSIHVKVSLALKEGDQLSILYGGKRLAAFSFADTPGGQLALDILIDRTLAEIFANRGLRYVLAYLGDVPDGRLEFSSSTDRIVLDRIEVYEMKSIWRANSPTAEAEQPERR